jgi:hypothetical protein
VSLVSLCREWPFPNFFLRRMLQAAWSIVKSVGYFTEPLEAPETGFVGFRSWAAFRRSHARVLLGPLGPEPRPLALRVRHIA